MNDKLNRLNPTERFNNRVENYLKFRPHYPEELFSFLETQLKLDSRMKLADIGSGTGLFAEPLLKKGYAIYCIEPNDEMRSAAEKHLSIYPGFISIDNRAEHTGLEPNSIDCIIVAQAFHWMNPIETKQEFSKILKDNGKIIICWILAMEDTEFLEKYEGIRKTFGIEYTATKRADESVLREFYSPQNMNSKIFYHKIKMDFEKLKGHLLSASFIPQRGHGSFNVMIDSLQELFDKYNENGFIEMKYQTIVFWNE
jgi:SAM-dependent methyltransferase